jgi:hypothetical protein
VVAGFGGVVVVAGFGVEEEEEAGAGSVLSFFVVSSEFEFAMLPLEPLFRDSGVSFEHAIVRAVRAANSEERRRPRFISSNVCNWRTYFEIQ